MLLQNSRVGLPFWKSSYLQADHVTSTQTESSTALRPGAVTIAIWLAAGIAIAGVAALLLSHTPARQRLIGILAAAQGAACGWLVSLVGTRLKMRSPVAAIVGGVVVGAASVALTSVLWWQAHARQLKADYKPPKGAAMAMAMLNQATDPSDPQAKKEMDDFRADLKARAMPPDTSFPEYLAFRVSSFSNSRSAGQILFGAELLLAGLLCAGFARARAARPFCESCGEWILPIRRHEFTGDDANEIAVLTGSDHQTPFVSASVVLSQCRCAGRRPEVLAVLESADRKAAVRRSSTDQDSPLKLAEEAFSELAARIDAAQGLR